MILCVRASDLKIPEGYEGVLICSDERFEKLQSKFDDDGFVTLGKLSFSNSSSLISIWQPLELTEVTIPKLLPIKSCSLDLQKIPKGTDGIVKGLETGCHGSHLKTKFGPTELLELYNDAAKRNGWQQCRSITEKLRKYVTPALKKYPEKEQWETILRGWEADPFFSGKSGVYDRIKILTMFFKTRYHDFYEDGLALIESPPKQSAEDYIKEVTEKMNKRDYIAEMKAQVAALKATEGATDASPGCGSDSAGGADA